MKQVNQEIDVLPALIVALNIISIALDPMRTEHKEYKLRDLKRIADKALELMNKNDNEIDNTPSSAIKNFYKGYLGEDKPLNKKDSVNNLRRVQVTFGDGTIRNGWFHTWSNVSNGEEESNPCAIVEFEDGACSIIFDINKIIFIDTYHVFKNASRDGE